MSPTPTAPPHGASGPAPGTGPPPGDDPASLAPRRLVPIVALLVLALVAMAFAGPWNPPLSGDATDVELPELPDTERPAQEDPLTEILEQMDIEPVDLGPWATGAVALVVVLLAAWALRVALRRREWRVPGVTDPLLGRAGDVVPGGAPSVPVLAEGADAAVAALREPRLPPRDAIIAAWVALEDAAQACGVARDPAATPTEFTLDVLDATPADGAAARTLLALYLRARFSTQEMTVVDVTAASDAARHLAHDLQAGRAPGGPGPGAAGTPGGQGPDGPTDGAPDPGTEAP